MASALVLLLAGPLPAQQDDEPETVILSRAQGTLVVDGRAVPLPWVESSSGPLLALRPVVEVLGGELEVGPLGDAHTLRVGGREVVLGPLGRQIVVDGAVRSLSVRPWVDPPAPLPDLPEDDESRENDGSEGDDDPGADRAAEDPPDRFDDPPPPRHLFAPVDALGTIWPSELGYRFDFDRRRGVLRVRNAGQPRLDLAIDSVHDFGVTTLVATFPRRPDFRLERRASGYRIQLLGAVLEPRRRSRLDDPLVRWLEVSERSLDVGLAPGAEVSAPYLVGRPPEVRLVMEVTRARGVRLSAAAGAQDRDEFRIVLDPGHGGTDSGLSTATGGPEKDVALSFARALESYLEAELGARVVLTRPDDRTVPVDNRTALANQHRADLLLSIHLSPAGSSRPGDMFQAWVLAAPARGETADSLDSDEPAEASDSAVAASSAEVPDGDGADEPHTEPFAFVERDEPSPWSAGDPSRSARSRDNAPVHRQRSDHGASDPALTDSGPPPFVMPPLRPWARAHDDQRERSALLARLVQTEVSDALGLRNRRIERAPLRVLAGAAMPAVLLEFGHDDSGRRRTALLHGPRGRDVLEAIAGAIRIYREIVSVEDDLPADVPAGPFVDRSIP